MNTATYLETLIARQDREGWSNREMARQLGVAEATWHRIRTGSRGMGREVLRRTMNRFPEYNGLAIIFLLESASTGSDSATIGTSSKDAA